ncbi:MAG TPA: hypothetical protein VE684_11915 [Crenalkalicoccus sp.]|jgi:hypothetical protein|nr:hypothetical protein [Crenalkalicoccus sp.]
MAIVAIILAIILFVLGSVRPELKRPLTIVAVICLVFAAVMAFAAPAEAWDLRFLGRLMTKVAGHGVKELLR